MSTILFKCENEKREEVKNKFWEILHNHYLNTVYPNTKVKYNNEREEVYTKRLTTLMEIELCNVKYTDNGVYFEFDSTE